MAYPNLVPSRPSVILLVADGARPDTLDAAIARGGLPALAQLRHEGSYHTVTTVFPSVTGPAYTPFLMGVHPATAGLPGLRWYDRSRSIAAWPDYARSYVGLDSRFLDRDLIAQHPTLFELIPDSLGALSVIQRGLARPRRIGRGPRFLARAAYTHFRGDLGGWLDIDRDVSDTFVHRVRHERPAFAFAALTGIDKVSHAMGHDAPAVDRALTALDDVVGRLRADAEQAGRWEDTHLWIVSDHGHAPIHRHDDLADALNEMGLRVFAHPRIWTRAPDVSVMVSGNAMAHLYFDPRHSARPYWPALAMRWGTVLDTVLARPSVDLAILPTAPGACQIRSGSRGDATLSWTMVGNAPSYTYLTHDGDPLGIGAHHALCANDAYDITRASEYPDALVQIAALCDSARVGDVIVSAAPGWDFRARFEPIPHVSSHGSLRRAHMLVPLLTNRPTVRTPRRTVDVMPSVLQLLGRPAPKTHGTSFV